MEERGARRMRCHLRALDQVLHVGGGKIARENVARERIPDCGVAKLRVDHAPRLVARWVTRQRAALPAACCATCQGTVPRASCCRDTRAMLPRCGVVPPQRTRKTNSARWTAELLARQHGVRAWR